MTNTLYFKYSKVQICCQTKQAGYTLEQNVAGKQSTSVKHARPRYNESIFDNSCSVR